MSSNQVGATETTSRPKIAWPILIAAAFVGGLLLRLIGLPNPPFDSHSFRQCQTLYTIEQFHGHGLDLLHPKTLYTGYPGTLVLELPLFQALAAVLYDIFGQHVAIVRLLNIVLGAATVWVLYRATAYLLGRNTARFATIIYWLAPLNVLYQRSTLLDPTAVLCGLLSFYALARVMIPRNGHKSWLVLFGFATWLTVMIKALYLWPAVSLLLYGLLRRRLKVDARGIAIAAILFISGASFLVWNHYAAEINNASPFTRGIKPTALLGMSALGEPRFYLNQLVNRPKWWVGILGVLLYPIGLWATWVERRAPAHTLAPAEQSWRVALLLFVIPPTYLLIFANINHPHEYYQLIITPFLAMSIGYGLEWLVQKLERSRRGFFGPMSASRAAAVLLIVTGLASYGFWRRHAQPNPKLLQFQNLCAGKIVPGSSAMLFASPSATGYPVGFQVPEYLYAARVWGYGKITPDTAAARKEYEKLAPDFPGLKYVVLYGFEAPAWSQTETFVLSSRATVEKLLVFERVGN
jgi:4-amino-4-deoxy-L-arabinose transferase-like glycosyltransferase